MSGHTPGPWAHRLSNDEEACAHEIMGAWEGNVRRWIGGAETLEDARLIAAAPDLLEALVEAAAFVDRHSEDWYGPGQTLLTQIRAAIAKATGATA